MTATPRRPSARPSRPSRPTCSSATRTCCIWACCPSTPPGPASLPASSSWSSTKCTPTGASWAATWPRCCGACGASAPTTAPSPHLSCLPPPSPSPETFVRQLTGLEVETIAESGAPQPGRHFLFLNPPGGAPSASRPRSLPGPSARASIPSASPSPASSRS